LEIPHDADKLEEIFEKYRYLLSEKLLERYLQYMREDTYFALYQARKSGQQLVFVNLKDMQSIVEKDYETLRKEYGQFLPLFGQGAFFNSLFLGCWVAQPGRALTW
jgi:hypothetical protein